VVDGERAKAGNWVSLKDNNAKDPATFALAVRDFRGCSKI